MDKTLYFKSKSFRITKYLLLIVLSILFQSSTHTDNSEIRILFVGDILLSRNVKEEIQIKKTFPWKNMESLFHSADLVVGNLEGAVGEFSDAINPNFGSPIFNIDSSDITLLKKAGFNAITLENNHSSDLGNIGKAKTIETLKANKITPNYFENSPQFFTFKEVVISLVSLNFVIGRDSLKNEIQCIEIDQKMRLARSLSNIVIVSVHWGSELLEWPNKQQREIANQLINQGADIIIGSHPHVVQQPELIQGKPVFFSLGNHLFDQKYPQSKEGLVVEIKIKGGKFNCIGIKTHTSPQSFYPQITDTVDYKFAPFDYQKSTLKVNNYLLKPLSVLDSNKNKIVLQAYQNGHKMWQTHPMTIIAINACNFEEPNEFLFVLEKHFSSLDAEMNVRPYIYSLDNSGLNAKWRGSALAWPLIDAQISRKNSKILCALHRGDSFIKLDKSNKGRRIAAYEWNGFGFKGVSDSIACKFCEDYTNFKSD